MNILIPMAGIGTRFENFYKEPKPLVKLFGVSLIEYSIKTLNIKGKYIFVTLKYNEPYDSEIKTVLKNCVPDCEIITIDTPTEGSAITCLFAKNLINNNEPLIITNCDQYLNWDSSSFLDFINNNNLDACVSIYNHDDVILGKESPYCFISLDEKGYINGFREKLAISNFSMNGLHYWRYGKDFVKTAERMIKENKKINNEFYLSESLNYLIEEKKQIKPFMMGDNEFFSLGTPYDIKKNNNKILKIINEKKD